MLQSADALAKQLSCKRDSVEDTLGCMRGLNASVIQASPWWWAQLVVVDGSFLDKPLAVLQFNVINQNSYDS